MKKNSYYCKEKGQVYVVGGVYLEGNKFAGVGIECYEEWSQEEESKMSIIRVADCILQDTISTENIVESAINLPEEIAINSPQKDNFSHPIFMHNAKISRGYSYYYQNPNAVRNTCHEFDWNETTLKEGVPNILRRINDRNLVINSNLKKLIEEIMNYSPESLFYRFNALILAVKFAVRLGWADK